jgi:hypothetical protein
VSIATERYRVSVNITGADKFTLTTTDAAAATTIAATETAIYRIYLSIFGCKLAIK